MKIASWLHDVGRAESGENHSKKSLEIVKSRFDKIPEKIKDCILNHGTNSTPVTEEGKIFRIADKMSLLSPELFLIYAREDKEGAIKFTKNKIDSFLKIYKESNL